MKKDIHPEYTNEATIACACGNSFVVGSTKKEIRIELCNECHPFYTGKQKFVDTARRVEKFQEKLERAKAAAATRKGKKAKRAAKSQKDETDNTKKPSKKASSK
jgi:large subunit ribosomal protein L31